jgi:hypothetical protein
MQALRARFEIFHGKNMFDCAENNCAGARPRSRLNCASTTLLKVTSIGPTEHLAEDRTLPRLS